MIEKRLLDILACPACKSAVRLENDKIVCEKCTRCYAIKDGVPIMLIDKAEDPASNKREGLR